MSKKISPILAAIATGVLLFSACAAAPNASPMLAQSERAADEAAPGAPPTGGTHAKDTANAASTDRLVIKNADLTIVVDDPDAAAQVIGQLAESAGGYVVSSNLYRTRTKSGIEVPQASITLRVPAEQLDEVLANIKKQATQETLSEAITSQDVTSEYTDLQSRLRNAQAAETELTRILEAADSTEDVLAVYAQIKAVREEIELLTGQIQYYEQSAAFSLIKVSLLAEESLQPLEIGGWKPQGVARDAIQALIYTMQFLASAAIWFVLFCAPVLVVLGVPLLLVLSGIRLAVRQARKPGKPKAPPPTPPQDAPVA
jgi:hypothetical protein